MTLGKKYKMAETKMKKRKKSRKKNYENKYF